MTSKSDSRAHAHATPGRTAETDRLFDEWNAAQTGEAGLDDLAYSEDDMRAAFAAGMVEGLTRGLGVTGNAIGLLTEASMQFRKYEEHHRAKAHHLTDEQETAATFAKAEVNRDLAERIEAFLLTDSTPKDRVYGLALSLVQDLVEMTELPVASISAKDWDSWEEALGQELWGSLTRLRAALDERVGTPGHSDLVGVILPAERMEPMCPTPSKRPPCLTLVVNGTEYRTHETSVRGKLGGCPIRAEWDASADLRVCIDTPGYVPPPSPPILYGSAGAAMASAETVDSLAVSSRQAADSQTRAANAATTAAFDVVEISCAGMADPRHDNCELPRCVLTEEHTVNGLFPGDPGYPKGGEVG